MPNKTASIAFTQDVSLMFDDMSSFAQMNLWLGQFWEKDTFVEGRDRRIMDELFLHFFEQYGEVTFLLLLCGYKGNGKTLRTERAMYVFPDDWGTMGGPASAKAGQNGTHRFSNQSHSTHTPTTNTLVQCKILATCGWTRNAWSLSLVLLISMFL